MKFIKNTILFLSILGLIIFIAYKGLNKLEETKTDDQIRIEKLNKGECKFDALPIDDILIRGFAKPLKIKMSLDSLKYVDPENNNISYAPYKNFVYMNVIKLDHTSTIQFLLGEEVIFDPSWRLPKYKEMYPISYDCREGADGPLTINIGIQINNSNVHSPIEYLKIFFNVAEQVSGIDVGLRKAI